MKSMFMKNCKITRPCGVQWNHKKKQQEMRLTDFQIVNALNFIHCRLVS